MPIWNKTFPLLYSFNIFYLELLQRKNIATIRVIKPLVSSTRHFLDFALSISNEGVREGVMTV